MENIYTRTENLLKFFEYEHLPPRLKKVSREFHEMAMFIMESIHESEEKYQALRKLLEAKDCAVRANL